MARGYLLSSGPIYHIRIVEGFGSFLFIPGTFSAMLVSISGQRLSRISRDWSDRSGGSAMLPRARESFPPESSVLTCQSADTVVAIDLTPPYKRAAHSYSPALAHFAFFTTL
ncbi:hypothetical protein J6590_076446 [Homalodisca vitripennis]|nr:hypothetical protein J6590_076446 [Homalodisca vitripennis]